MLTIFFALLKVLFYLLVLTTCLQFGRLIPSFYGLTSYFGSLLLIAGFAWHGGAFIFKHLVNPKLGRINPAKKWIFISGCDTGFGNLFALALNRLGFSVFAGCLKPDSPEAKLLKETAQFSDNLIVIPLDISSATSISSSVDKVAQVLRERDEELFALINNAGIASANLIEWGSMSTMTDVINVNVIGTINVTTAFVPMLKQSKGRIIIMSSLSSRLRIPILSPYCMSKTAINSFADTLRRQLVKDDVKVIVIEPSSYKTNITDLTHMSNLLKKSWRTTSESVQKAYGEDMYQAIVTILTQGEKIGFLNAFRRSDLSEVTKVIIESVMSAQPEYQYMCSDYLGYIILWFVSTFIPVDPVELGFAMYAKSIQLIVGLMNLVNRFYVLKLHA